MAEPDLEPGHLETVRRILREHLPEAEVRAFGSRVAGGARQYSDLDLAVVETSEFDWGRLSRVSTASRSPTCRSGWTCWTGTRSPRASAGSSARSSS